MFLLLLLGVFSGSNRVVSFRGCIPLFSSWGEAKHAKTIDATERENARVDEKIDGNIKVPVLAFDEGVGMLGNIRLYSILYLHICIECLHWILTSYKFTLYILHTHIQSGCHATSWQVVYVFHVKDCGLPLWRISSGLGCKKLTCWSGQ